MSCYQGWLDRLFPYKIAVSQETWLHVYQFNLFLYFARMQRVIILTLAGCVSTSPATSNAQQCSQLLTFQNFIQCLVNRQGLLLHCILAADYGIVVCSVVLDQIDACNRLYVVAVKVTRCVSSGHTKLVFLSLLTQPFSLKKCTSTRPSAPAPPYTAILLIVIFKTRIWKEKAAVFNGAFYLDMQAAWEYSAYYCRWYTPFICVNTHREECGAIKAYYTMLSNLDNYFTTSFVSKLSSLRFLFPMQQILLCNYSVICNAHQGLAIWYLYTIAATSFFSK